MMLKKVWKDRNFSVATYLNFHNSTVFLRHNDVSVFISFVVIVNHPKAASNHIKTDVLKQWYCGKDFIKTKLKLFFFVFQRM